MNAPVESDLGLGLAFHGVGALFAACCYTPQNKVRGWSWQTYWLVQAAFCWLLLPVLGAWLTIPELGAVLAEAPRDAMAKSFLLGAFYGIGGTAFGVAIRHIGFSLAYAIAIGLSAVLGTLVPPLVKGELGEHLSRPGGGWVLGGIVAGTLGIALCGIAGRLKEKDLPARGTPENFSLGKGLALSLLAGVLSAVYGFALEAGQPVADAAARHGAGVWQGNVIYLFANTGAFVTTLAYCVYLHLKHRTGRELTRLPTGATGASLPMNFLLAALTGFLWYGQFFFYNLAHVRMGAYKFVSWGVHMTMLVLFSNLVGILLKEWVVCRPRTRFVLHVALSVLVVAVFLLVYGDRLGGPATQP